ncbi:sulfatase-like hydrolase/transferase [Roseibacillus ishigakijimensis]|uniref:Sulfatase-like hydrolase/transferase n=1 Tax=Roseibacillus ishigakijimensis TaxID=454146 RepID=A0A934RTC7_9BACT|nr:sulfatase-like hydrolase/transferase [Roseibacillus ishigakijimensis]MBK1835271.1 sulfatase-like hydrolase/transferase [Roseibacillus ishigakijimensis]
MKHFFLLFPFFWAALTASPQRPNIITVFIDDLGYSDLSCFGGQHAQTENIDRLAQEGIRFTQFYVNSPICSPSRVALTTGQYPQRWQITSYLNHRRANHERGMAQWLDPEAPILARELQQAGYATGHFGKWHMGGQRDVYDAPLIEDYGFDRSTTNFEGLGKRFLPLCDPYDGSRKQRHDLGSARLGRGPIIWKDRSQITAAFVTEALTFIKEATEKEQPFFLNLWPDDVHSPFFPPEVLRDESDGSKRALYYAVLEAMDEQLAPLFDHIRHDKVLRENTLIILCSDNGHEEGAGSSKPLRGAKTWLYEGGIRSPLIVWGPGLQAGNAPGSTNTTSVFSALDLNRSLYSLTHTDLPAGHSLDGEDLSAVLQGERAGSRQAPLFWRRPPDRPGEGGQANPDLAMRQGDWKLLVNYEGTEAELYHLGDDPGEKNNLAPEKEDLVQAMSAQLKAWNEGLPRDEGDPAYAATAPLADDHFVNAIGEGADPWVVRDAKANRYLWCFSDGNRGIAIHTSDSLTSLGEKHLVWRAPAEGPFSREVWAPELHFLEGHWHIYMAASDGQNRNHLAYVLRSRTADPLGEYDLHGPLATGEGADGRSPNLWAIDMTPLPIGDRLYAIWSGWDGPDTDRQFLYIAPMKSPTELSGPRVRLCGNADYPWEMTEPEGRGRGLNEGPQVVPSPRRTLVTYSCGASWLPTYKLGLLELIGDDPLDPAAWKKHPEPVFRSTKETYGVGHSCFAPSPDGTEWWHLFHAKRDREPGWRRAIFAQPMFFNDQGYPEFGLPVPANVPLPRPSGEPLGKFSLPYENTLQQPATLEGWDYYGHHQLYQIGESGLTLGQEVAHPVNVYRGGEKMVLSAPTPADFSASVTIDFQGGAESRDAGLLFRTTAPSVGYDAHRGYFAGLIPRTRLLVAGKMDGHRWQELHRVALSLDHSQPHHLRVQGRGPRFTISLNDEEVLTFRDETYPTGRVGLRVVDTAATFRDFSLSELSR